MISVNPRMTVSKIDKHTCLLSWHDYSIADNFPDVVEDALVGKAKELQNGEINNFLKQMIIMTMMMIMMMTTDDYDR